jgi:hypothetical protein
VEGQLLSGGHQARRDAGVLRRAPAKTVEINNTFYRMPKEDVLDNWAKAAPKEESAALDTKRGRVPF